MRARGRIRAVAATLACGVAAIAVAVAAPVTAPAAAQVWAEGAPEIPRFEVCLPERMEAFEVRLRAMPGYGRDWLLGALNLHWVQHCGYLAIGICDVSAGTSACQGRLRAAWEGRAAALRADLPDPGGVDGLPLAPLYAQVWALAWGSEAGDDCAGRDARGEEWCRAFEAALAYERVVHAWQVGRLMGVLGPLDWGAAGVVDE